MVGVFCVYFGLVLATLGLLARLIPARWMYQPLRRVGWMLVAIGASTTVAGFAVPTSDTRITMPVTTLDEFAPAYQFHELHTLHIDASPADVYRAVKEVSASDIRFFRTLTWIRRFGRSGPESILQAPERTPLLEVATRTTFVQLADIPDQEVVIGSLVHGPPGARRGPYSTPATFKALQDSGFVKAVMNFRMEPEAGGGTLVSTETRVFATDRASARHFRVYWRIIYPGSAIIRREWLRAIRRRAESKKSAGGASR